MTRNDQILAAREHFAGYIRSNGLIEPNPAFVALALLVRDGKSDRDIKARLSWGVKGDAAINEILWLCRQYAAQHTAQAKLACSDMESKRGFAAAGRVGRS